MAVKNSQQEQRAESRAAAGVYMAGILFYLISLVITVIDLISGRSIWDVCIVVFAVSAYYNYYRSSTSKSQSYRTMFGIQAFAAVVSLILYFIFK